MLLPTNLFGDLYKYVRVDKTRLVKIGSGDLEETYLDVTCKWLNKFTRSCSTSWNRDWRWGITSRIIE